MIAKLEALQQPIHQLTGDYEEPILGTVLNESCRRCHTNDTFSRPVSKNGIRVQHSHLVAAGFLCKRCHSTTAHRTAVPVGSRTYPIMEQCLICHNNHYTAADGTSPRLPLRPVPREAQLRRRTRLAQAAGLEHSPRCRRRAFDLQRLAYKNRIRAPTATTACSCHTRTPGCTATVPRRRRAVGRPASSATT